MKKLIRKSSLNLNYATDLKKDKLDTILTEYKRVVNLYISALFQVDKLNLSAIEKVDTWLSARMQQCAGKQAIGIVRSNRTIANKRRYKHYKKVYKYFKKHKRQLEFLSKKYKDLNIIKYRKLPVYNGNVMELDERFIGRYLIESIFLKVFPIYEEGKSIIKEVQKAEVVKKLDTEVVKLKNKIF